jgi:hypothetical protein
LLPDQSLIQYVTLNLLGFVVGFSSFRAAAK